MTVVVSSAVPADTEELYRLYASYIRSIVRRHAAIPPQELDDITSEIMTRLLERDVLGMFDPAHHIEYDGKVVAPKFRTFLTNMVMLYVKSQRDKLGRYQKRNILKCDAPAGDGSVTWAEMFGGSWFDDYPSESDTEFVGRMRTYLAMLPPRTAHDKLNLVELFDEMLAEIYVDGQVSSKAIQARFSVSPSTASVWLAYLRQRLKEFAGETPLTEREPVVVGGIVLTLADAQSALKVLAEDSYIMVRQPLVRAGHPLAGAAAGWYHEVAKAELKVYPECGTAAGSHKKAADHTKRAVIHWLERILDEAGCPQVAAEPVTEPEEAPGPRDLLEAELWAAGLEAARVDKLLSLADQMVTA